VRRTLAYSKWKFGKGEAACLKDRSVHQYDRSRVPSGIEKARGKKENWLIAEGSASKPRAGWESAVASVSVGRGKECWEEIGARLRLAAQRKKRVVEPEETLGRRKTRLLDPWT